MTRNEQMVTSHDINPERVRELLEGVQRTRAEFDASMAAFHAAQVGVQVSMSEEQYRLQRLMYSANNKLAHSSPALAEAYLESAAQVEALTLERDRLAHELRLLREAVGQPAAVPWHHIKTGGIYTEVCRAQVQASAGAALEGDEVVVYRGADGRLWAREADEFLERFTQLEGWLKAEPVSLSSDTPERSGGEG